MAYAGQGSTDITKVQVEEFETNLRKQFADMSLDDGLYDNLWMAVESELLIYLGEDSEGRSSYRFSHQLFHDFLAGRHLTSIQPSLIKDVVEELVT